jgi:hypothetical protein
VLNVIVLSVAFSYCLARCRYVWRRHVECRGANVSVKALIREAKKFCMIGPRYDLTQFSSI